MSTVVYAWMKNSRNYVISEKRRGEAREKEKFIRSIITPLTYVIWLANFSNPLARNSTDEAYTRRRGEKGEGRWKERVNPHLARNLPGRGTMRVYVLSPIKHSIQYKMAPPTSQSTTRAISGGFVPPTAHRAGNERRWGRKVKDEERERSMELEEAEGAPLRLTRDACVRKI